MCDCIQSVFDEIKFSESWDHVICIAKKYLFMSCIWHKIVLVTNKLGDQ